MIGDITLIQIMAGIGSGVLIFGGFATLLYLINYIINWVWWKKENCKDFYDLRFFFNHRDEIKEYIKGNK